MLIHSNCKICSQIVHIMWWVLGDISCDLHPKVKVKGQLSNFLVNAFPPKPFGVVASIFVGA